MPVVSLVKGLEQGTNYRMSEIVDEVLPGHPAGILAGPNIAREVAEGYAAAAVLAMPDQHLAANLANLFRTKRFRTYTTDDVVGVEMAGALKNVYAIAVGMGYSLGIGENTRAMVIARAVREMSKLGEAMGGHRDTFAGLAGMGDLIVTCTSQRSRNRHVGEQLGAGKPIDEIIASMNQVAEGVKAASVIMEFADEVRADTCRSRARSTASSTTAPPSRTPTAAWPPRSPATRCTARVSDRPQLMNGLVPSGRSSSGLTSPDDEAARRADDEAGLVAAVDACRHRAVVATAHRLEADPRVRRKRLDLTGAGERVGRRRWRSRAPADARR